MEIKKISIKEEQPKTPSCLYKSDGSITTEAEEIKAEVKKEFEHRLRNREAAKGWENYVETTNELVDSILNGEAESRAALTLLVKN